MSELCDWIDACGWPAPEVVNAYVETYPSRAKEIDRLMVDFLASCGVYAGKVTKPMSNEAFIAGMRSWLARDECFQRLLAFSGQEPDRN